MCVGHQGKRKCECKDNYVGDGINCEAKVLPVNRCLQDNGQCHSDAQCTDLHYEGMHSSYALLPTRIFIKVTLFLIKKATFSI